MSKRDILTVCMLAAHLAQRQHTVETGIGCFEEYIRQPQQCAADAMALQRLGRSARNMYARNAAWRASPLPDYHQWGPAKAREQDKRIREQAAVILRPYGLTCDLSDGSTATDSGPCLHILGLPGNTLGGDEAGYGI